MEDKYVWMENLKDERVSEIVNEENERFRNFVEPLSSKFFPEVKEYYNLPNILEARITSKGIIVKVNEYGRQRIKNIDTGEILIDSEDIEKEVGDEILLQSFYVDDECRRLVYTFSIGGSDEGITRVVNLDIGEKEEIDYTMLNVVFLDKGYYFSRIYRKDKTPDGVEAPAHRMFLRIGEKESMVFGKGLGPGYFIYLLKSSDKKSALVSVSFGWNKNDIYYGPLGSPEKWEKIYSSDVPCEPIDAIGDTVYIVTREGNGLGKIIKIKNGALEEVVGESENLLEWAVILKDKIIAGYLIDASTKIKIFTLDGELKREIKFDTPAQVYPLDRDPNMVILRYESFMVPYRLYALKEDLELLDEVKIEGKFEIEEDFAISKDGTKIHYFMVKGEKDLKKAWVFGYGGFNVSLTPRFYSHIVPFIKRGGTFIMANLRGGGEYGEEWHRAGMREKKQNVFDDFIAVLENLKKQGYKVAAWGRSNGGLLISATLVQRADVMDSAIIGYPVIDMLRFHKLYIGSVWIPEYGNPDNPEDREFLLQYSPYHNLKPGKYPPIMIYTGLHDDRVHPAHALKFFMKLKDIGAPVYLRVETKSGHLGASPDTRIKELSDMLAFVCITLGVKF
ncbi:peptidase S9 [Euryarchaeota archaeon ex4484_178]|nr:MAG: peptidase S9 [Euryarchaeota archaeon ex4484_178]